MKGNRLLSTVHGQSLDGKDVWPTVSGGQPSPHEDILINAS